MRERAEGRLEQAAQLIDVQQPVAVDVKGPVRVLEQLWCCEKLQRQDGASVWLARAGRSRARELRYTKAPNSGARWRGPPRGLASHVPPAANRNR